MTDTPMTPQEKLLRRLSRIITFTAVVVVFLAVVVAGLEIQVQSRNQRLARLDVAVQQTKVAADKATAAANDGTKVINNALAEAKSSGAGGPTAARISQGLNTIDVIRQELELLLNRKGISP